MLEMWGAGLRRLWEELVVGIDCGGPVDRAEKSRRQDPLR